MFKKKFVEKIKTNFMFINFFFRNSYLLWDNVGKCGVAGQAADDMTAHARSMLDASHSGNFILPVSPLQHWLHESA
jgi:hypothetical protein